MATSPRPTSMRPSERMRPGTARCSDDLVRRCGEKGLAVLGAGWGALAPEKGGERRAALVAGGEDQLCARLDADQSLAI
jgi:hypothetical protein